MSNLYERDFAAWADAQADALRRRSVKELDWDHLVEEIEGLSARDRRQIRNRLPRILEHLLKLAYFPAQELRRQWRRTVVEQRQRLTDLLEESPSLAPYPAAVLERAYANARMLIMHAPPTGPNEPDLPASCPWPIEQVLNPDFWP
jgi:hypothetical protein